MTQLTTIKQVKDCFRAGNALYIDHNKDVNGMLQYIYRLERREIISPRCFNKSFGISVYAVNPAKVRN